LQQVTGYIVERLQVLRKLICECLNFQKCFNGMLWARGAPFQAATTIEIRRKTTDVLIGQLFRQREHSVRARVISDEGRFLMGLMFEWAQALHSG
jgi:hypothetical protein